MALKQRGGRSCHFSAKVDSLCNRPINQGFSGMFKHRGHTFDESADTGR